MAMPQFHIICDSVVGHSLFSGSSLWIPSPIEFITCKQVDQNEGIQIGSV
jgi:hypothetical protein